MAVNRQFYVDRAVQHGGMAVYYLEQIKTLTTLIPHPHESEMAWAVNNAPIEAREAWHYALLVTQGETSAELERQAEEDRQDRLLEF